MRQPIPPQLEVAAAAAEGPDAGMGRTASVRQPLDDTHGCCGHGAGAQEVAGRDRARHASLQPPYARRSKMPTSRLRAMPLDAAASTPRCSTPPGRCFRAAAAFAPPLLHAAAASTPRRSTPPQPPRPHAISARRRRSLRVPLLDAAATLTPSQPPRPRCSIPLQLPSLAGGDRARHAPLQPPHARR
ncbi:hypothetical protein PVAP13_2NG171103 [Panicum virgatum]|uniref:Uncharacterized protein n=1 Tax=Panicum virgatum TaxID=38727 RepID=A0A8T0VDD7_PANVG|nr:hypothetical protein PVAP13_2NG171103 [Panicum virgatum]